LTTTLRHEPTADCDGTPASTAVMKHGRLRAIPLICRECDIHLCGCEEAYGHDCEA
jgi:hypothetical protein